MAQESALRRGRRSKPTDNRSIFRVEAAWYRRNEKRPPFAGDAGNGGLVELLQRELIRRRLAPVL